MKKKNKQLLPILSCALAFALWGLNTPLVKTSLETIPLFSLLFIKFGTGAVFFLFLAQKTWKPMKRNVRFRIIIATIIGYVISTLLMYKGIQLSGGLNASLIYLLAPMLLYIASIRFLKEKYDSKLLVGVIAGFIGAILIIGTPLFAHNGQINMNLIGNVLVLLAVCSDVTSTVLIKPVYKKIPVLQMVALRFLIATIILLPLAAFELPKLLQLTFDSSATIAIAYNLIFATLIAFYTFTWGLRQISGEQLSPLHYIDPMIGAVGSILILSERPTTLTVLGIICIVCGLYFSEANKLKLKHHIGHHR